MYHSDEPDKYITYGRMVDCRYRYGAVKYLKRAIHLVYFLYRYGKEVICGYSTGKTEKR